MRVHTIVIGAGSGGAVVASRLSERSDRDVLLIEAGPDYRPEVLPESLANGRLNAATHDWGFKHSPAARSLRIPLPRGKVVGGSSAVNTCIAIRALPRDIDEWADRGLKDWTWDQCLPAFCAIETDADFGDAPYHGGAGPLPLRRHPRSELGPWQAAFLEAAWSAGYPECADTNNPDTPEGFGAHAMNKRGQRRISAAEAWLTPEVRGREGFSLMAEAEVTALRFEGARVVGVTVRRRGETQTIHAERVVLCAGVFQTPRLLLRAGIGPAAELSRLGVERRVHLPGVGARLLDHPGFAFFLRPRKRGVVDRDGGVIQTALRFTVGDVDSDIQMQAGSTVPIGRTVLPGVAIMAMIGKPRGVGTVRWRSLDDDAKPTVDSDFLADPVDRARACETLHRGWEMARRAPMSDLARPLAPTARMLSDPRRLDGVIRRFCDSGYHPCGTAPMGADDDPEAACDGRGRVRGVEGLYVADASLMPTIPTGNIHLTTLMIGERIGCWLRDEG